MRCIPAKLQCSQAFRSTDKLSNTARSYVCENIPRQIRDLRATMHVGIEPPRQLFKFNYINSLLGLTRSVHKRLFYYKFFLSARVLGMFTSIKLLTYRKNNFDIHSLDTTGNPIDFFHFILMSTFTSPRLHYYRQMTLKSYL